MNVILMLLACTTPPDSSAAVSVPLTGQSTLTLASAEQGREALGRTDVYINTQGALERQIRLGSKDAVSREQFIEHVRRQVLPWDPQQQKKLAAAGSSLAEKLAGLKVPLPKQVLLIQTTGQDESGAAYTRGNAIVLSKQRAAARAAGLERLLTHELFHVVSRHDPQLRRKLYAIIGFSPCDPITLPAQIEAVKITNPDAPTIDYYITIEHEGKKVDAVPILFSDRSEVDPQRNRLFNFLQFRLLAVERQDGRWRPLLRDGQPVLIDGRKNESYRKQIGGNTNYIIHPDEILADNFVHLVMRDKDLKSPEIIERMRQTLRAHGNGADSNVSD